MDKESIKQEITYQKLKKNDLAEYSEFINTLNDMNENVLHIRDNSAKYYEWMYYKNPCGKAIVYIARHKNKIIGSFAIAPKLFKIGDKTVKVGKTMDMFTHTQYRGLGLMSKLSSAVFEETNESGVFDWYVTPSQNSYPIFLNKWRYKEPFELSFKMKVIDYKSFLNFLNFPSILSNIFGKIIHTVYKMKSPVDIKVREIIEFGEETDELWRKMKEYIGIGLVRNSEYMNWRYIENPDNYKIYFIDFPDDHQGIIVIKYTIRRGLKIGEIVDVLLSNPDSQIKKLLYLFVNNLFKQNGCVIAQTWAIKNTLFQSFINKNGFFLQRGTIKFLLNPDSECKILYDKTKWYLTQGDGNDI